jgi:methionyl-tRNA synthetase
MRSISFGQDGDFSIEDVIARYSADLGNALGNLLNRILPFADVVPAKAATTPLEETLVAAHREGAKLAAEAFDAHVPTRALDAIWGAIIAANAYVDKAAPWTAKKNDPARLGTIIATLVEFLEAVSVMIAPVMPVVADAIREQLGLAALAPSVGRDQWPFELPTRAPGGVLRRGAPIFPRFEKEKEQELIARFAPPAIEARAAKETGEVSAAKAEGAAKPAESKALVEFADFAKLDLRVGLVVAAERVKKKDKLLDLRVDTGDAEPRRIIAGLASSYAPEALVGRRVIVLCNLAPRDFGKGLVSQGMLLAADGGERLATLGVDGDERPGTPIH